MTLTQHEAEKLARHLLVSAFMPDAEEVQKLCCFILSGSMKREIENAAYERAALAIAAYVSSLGDASGLYRAEKIIRALITPAKTADTEG